MLVSFLVTWLLEVTVGLDLRTNGTCPDAQVGLQCEEHCLGEVVPCRLNCGTDVDCLLGCSLEMVDCINGCPCFVMCPNGCSGCNSSFCQCTGDPTDDPNFQICREQLDDEYYKCIVACPPQDLTCINQCIREENENLENCPCMPGCLTGCRCPNYVCPGQKTTSASTTTTASPTSTTANRLTSVLVLNTYMSSNVPLVVDGQGRSRQARFEYGQDTESFASCSLLWKGQFYVFGGYYKNDQVSKVAGCWLERIGSLRFELVYGGCATDLEDNIYLCFGLAATKTCRKGETPTGDFTQIAQSTYEHIDTRVSASSEFLFAVGSYSPSNNKAELFSFDKDSWKTTTSYPYASGISLVFILNKGEDFFIFGGWNGSELDKIVKFKTTTENWTQIGSLNKARQGHGVIQTGESFLIVGGWSGAYPTEKCDFDQPDKMTCVTMEPTLSGYVQYPELLLVEADYCT